MTTINLESNLVQHAKRELEILGCAEDDIECVLKVISAFADLNPSGGQASWLIPIIYDLMQFKNLTPITDDPKEWNKVGEDLWQNSRNSEAFSQNRGRTYYLLSEGGRADNPHPQHVSVLKKHQ